MIVPDERNSQKPHWYPEEVTLGPVLISFNEEMANDHVTMDRITSTPNSTLLTQVRELPQHPQVTIWQQLAAKTNPPPTTMRMKHTIPVERQVRRRLHKAPRSISVFSMALQSLSSTDLVTHLLHFASPPSGVTHVLGDMRHFQVDAFVEGRVDR